MGNVETASMHKRVKTAQINLRLVPALKEAVETAAAADKRSVTSLIEQLLVDYLSSNGYVKGRAGRQSRSDRSPPG